MKTLRDLMGNATEAIILCLYSGTMVRRLTVKGDNLHIDAITDDVEVPLDTPIIYEPWVLDRGNMLLDSPKGRIKLCTEADILQLPGGTMKSINLDNLDNIPEA